MCKNYNLNDWIELHSTSTLDIKQLLSISGCIKCKQCNSSMDTLTPYLSAKKIWVLSSKALSEKFSDNAEYIKSVELKCSTDFSADKAKQPYTSDLKQNGTVHVSLHYQGSASDVLNVVHEFSHALQIYMNKGEFTPPALREVAAFLGEFILLDYLKAQKYGIYPNIKVALLNDNAIYIGQDMGQLLDDLEDTFAPYSYRWNYPVARIIAYSLFHHLNKKDLWQVFLGNWSMSKCIKVIQSLNPSTNTKLLASSS